VRELGLVDNNRFTRIGRKGELQAPAGATRVDLTGKTVMPTIIDGHSRPGHTVVNAFFLVLDANPLEDIRNLGGSRRYTSTARK